MLSSTCATMYWLHDVLILIETGW